MSARQTPFARIARSAMLDVLREPFITAGWAKGLGEPAVVYKRALKAALIPTITIVDDVRGELLRRLRSTIRLTLG